MLTDETHKRAITRNLHELANARLERCILISFDHYLEANGVYHYGENFFTITERALFNCMIGHAIKVLDRNKDSATFWAIFDSAPDKIKNRNCFQTEKLRFLDKLTEKLKIVRDKTHFHIDKNGVLNPQAIWEEAGITGDEFGEGLEYTWSILRELHSVELGRQFHDPCERYNGEDVVQMLESACSIGVLRPGPPVKP